MLVAINLMTTKFYLNILATNDNLLTVDEMNGSLLSRENVCLPNDFLPNDAAPTLKALHFHQQQQQQQQQSEVVIHLGTWTTNISASYSLASFTRAISAGEKRKQQLQKRCLPWLLVLHNKLVKFLSLLNPLELCSDHFQGQQRGINKDPSILLHGARPSLSS
jgi:hypothetical protein